MNKEKTGTGIYITVLLFLAAVRIWLACHTNYAAVPTGPYDEELQVSLGLRLAAGQWLGAYSQYTLIKGIVYPLFLALCVKLGITYGMGLGIVMVGSAMIFQTMLGLVTKNRVLRGICYTYVLYSPVAMTSWSGLRIYRDVLAPWLLLILVSCLAAVWFLRTEPFRKSLPWFAGLAVSFMLFYNLREDSIWILPLVCTGLLLAGIGRVMVCRKAASPDGFAQDGIISGSSAKSRICFVLPYLLCCLLPFAASAGWEGVISQNNLLHYGIALPNDRVKGNFARVMSLISSVEDPAANEKIWISNEMLRQCIEASPTLKRMESEIEARRWVTADGQGSDEVLGDYMQWALRNALSDSGFYRDAVKTEGVLGKIASELEAAYADGRLKKDGRIHLSSQGRGLKAGELLTDAGMALGKLPALAVYAGCPGYYPYHTACKKELLKRYQLVLGIDLGPETVNSVAYRTAASAGSALTALYRILGAVLAILCLTALAAGTAAVFMGKNAAGGKNAVSGKNAAGGRAGRVRLPSGDVVLLAWGLLLSAFALVYMVTLFTAFLDRSFFYNYTSAFYALLPAAECLMAGGMAARAEES